VVVFPVHLNPHVQDTVIPALRDVPNVFLTAPLDYPAFARVMEKSFLILTDSGGIQEEAPSLGVPVLVMRAVTERQEGIDAGNARLVGTDTAAILASVRELWNDASVHDQMSHAPNPYGDGTASARIARTVADAFGSDGSRMSAATGSGAATAR
jgi:UDP-N-acetylglucosamine 2-epimerase (non-hydrolysing)